MKLQAEILPIIGAHVDSRHHWGRNAEAWSLETRVVAEGQEIKQSSTAAGWPSRLQIVGILAFIQSLLFLALWLWICANAGAGTPPTADFKPDLQQSRYDPVKQRDPFAKAGATTADAKTLPAAALVFHLSGILYQPTNPSAVVNDKLLTLNKTVTLNAGNGEVQVKAVEITRDRVVLEAGGQKVELRMNSQNPPAAQP